MEVRIAWTPIIALLVIVCCLATERSLVAAKGKELKNCHPPSIRTQEGPTKYYILNETVTMACIARGGNGLNYKWLKNGDELILDKSRTDYSIEAGTGNLNIRKVVVLDSGKYQCVVEKKKCGISVSAPSELLHAHLRPFPQVEKPEVIQAILGSSVKLKCRRPFSVPKATIDWELIGPPRGGAYDEDNPGPSSQTVKKGRRVTMDYDGNLYITSLREEDMQNGRTYVCKAENWFTRSSARGEDKLVVTKGKITNMGVMLMWHSKTDNVVLQGKIAKFKCIFSGQPEPEIVWTRLKRGTWDEGRMTRDYHELIIERVQFEDAGDYMCSGRNSHSKQFMNHTFHLEVKAAPEWRVNPRSQDVGVGEKATFECDAVGNPQPSVQWFINGKPYSKDMSKGVLNGNMLSFENLDEEDSQVIQCNASNIYGYLWADFYLFVQALPPDIVKKPDDELVVAQDSDVIVSCEVEGKPKPRVVWYKGGQILTGERFVIQDKGSLLIKDATINDKGVYKCETKNPYGDEEASGAVVVRRKTEIIEPPVSQKVDYNNQVTFTCGAHTDENEVLTIGWLKDNKTLDVKDKRIKVNQGVLTITGTQSKDTGTYLCVAENGLDRATAPATLEVKAPPDPPYDPTIVLCLGRGARVSWKFDESMSNFNPMVSFIVEAMDNYSPHTWKKVSIVNFPGRMASPKLSPHATYKFRVKAVNKMGVGNASVVTPSNCTTVMAPPDKNPDDVRTNEEQTGHLVVQWKAMELIELNGNNFRYELKIQDMNTGNMTEKSFTDHKTNTFSMPVDTVYSPYLITVTARNAAGYSTAKPKAVLGHSGEGVPNVKVGDFDLDPDINVTATMAGFRWSPVDTSKKVIQGKFRGYKIRYWKKGQKDTTMRNHVIRSTADDDARRKRDVDDDGYVRGRVVDLPSFSEIVADVVVINQNHASQGSNKIDLVTPEGVPGPVEYIEALSRGINHINLFWQPPKHPNGFLTSYRLSYTKIDSLDMGDAVVVSDSISPDDRRYTLTGLEESTQYRISMTASTVQGWGERYFIDVVTASRSMELAPPKIEEVLALDNEANVSWSLDLSEEGTRIGYTYYLEHRKKGESKWHTSNEPIEDRQWAYLDHLVPGTTYHVRVVAKDGNNSEGAHSEEHMFRTSGVGAARGSFLSAAWFIGMMIAIAILILILIIVCIVKRNRGDNYPVQEKERLRGNCDDNHDNFNGFGKGSDENGIGVSSSFDRDGEKVPLDADADSMDYGDDDAGPFNEDGSFIGQYGRGDKSNDMANNSASSNV